MLYYKYIFLPGRWEIYMTGIPLFDLQKKMKMIKY